MKDFNKKFSYPNHTTNFLFPILRMYGEEFTKMMGRVFVYGVFIDDILVKRPDDDDYLHVVIDLQMTALIANDDNVVFDVVAWMVENGFVSEYYKLDTAPGKLVLIIRIPDKYQGCVDKFLKGDMSLYTQEDIDKYFHKIEPKLDEEYRYVISKSEEYFTSCRRVLTRGAHVNIDLDKEVLNL